MHTASQCEQTSRRFCLGRSWSLVACLLCLLVVPLEADSAQESESVPVISVGTPVNNGAAQQSRASITHGLIQLAPGSASGTVPVIVSATRLSKDLMTIEPQLVDAKEYAETSSPQIKFTSRGELEPGDSTRTWLFTADIEGLPLNTNQKRFAKLSLGGFVRVIEFVMTNQPPGKYTWSVAAPPTIVAWRDGLAREALAALVVTVGEVPATGLRIAQYALNEKVTGAAIAPGALKLCGTADKGCGEIGTLEPNRSHTVYLHATDGRWWHGDFSGSLLLGVDQKQDTLKLDVQMQSSSFEAKLLGCLLICAGVFGAYLLTVRGNGRAARLHALMPVAAINRHLDGLIEQIELPGFRGTPAWTRLRTRLTELRDRVSVAALDEKAMLPPEHPYFYKAGKVADIAPYLAGIDMEVAGLALLIRTAVVPLLHDAEAAQGAEKQKHLDALNRVTSDLLKVTSEETSRAHIKAAALPERPTSGMAQPRLAARPAMTAAQINISLHAVNGWAWLAWGLLVSLGGMIALVLTEPGFGTLLDYVLCFIWGFGVPVAAGKLKDLAPGTITTSLMTGPVKP